MNATTHTSAGQRLALWIADELARPLRWAIRRGFLYTGGVLWALMLDAVLSGAGAGLLAAAPHLPAVLMAVAGVVGVVLTGAGRIAAGLLALGLLPALFADLVRRRPVQDR